MMETMALALLFRLGMASRCVLRDLKIFAINTMDFKRFVVCDKPINVNKRGFQVVIKWVEWRKRGREEPLQLSLFDPVQSAVKFFNINKKNIFLFNQQTQKVGWKWNFKFVKFLLFYTQIRKKRFINILSQ